jgi:hypothetical protein
MDEVCTVAYLLSHKPTSDLDAYIEAAAYWVRGCIDKELKRMTAARSDIEEAFQTLTPREARVLTLRFGLDADAPRGDDGFTRGRTLEMVGCEFSISPERIRQIEQKALRKLRHPSRSEKLRRWLFDPNAVFDSCVDRRKLWGLAWWVDRWSQAREDSMAAQIKYLSKTLENKDKEIGHLNLELTRAQAMVEEAKRKSLAELPLPVSLKEMSLEQLGLPVRIKRALWRANVHTVGDYLLLGLDDKEKKHIRGLGVKSLWLLRAKIEEIGKEGKKQERGGSDGL